MFKSKIITSSLLLAFLFSANTVYAADYTVVEGDSLWKISQKYKIPIERITQLNHLQSDFLSVGQLLHLDNPTQNIVQETQSSQVTTTNQIGWINTNKEDLQEKAAITTVTKVVSATPAGSQLNGNPYLVKPGDTLAIIAKRFSVTVEDLRRVNNIQGDLIYAGQTLLLTSGVSRGNVNRPEATEIQGNSLVAQEKDEPLRYGQLVDWFNDGINILKPGKVFDVTDTLTGKTIHLKVLGGSNHCDVEPLTKKDTDTMLSLFTKWTWEPRSVCIHVDGKDIAASLSGMPHTDIENIKDNNVTGHFDMYLLNSKPHGSGISKSYVQQHLVAVQMASAK